MGACLTVQDVAKMIDHSLLRPELTLDDIREGCRVAREYGVASVCVRPSELDICRELLAGSGVALSTVIGFPHGCTTTAAKVFEAQDAMQAGCVELDMVLNIGRLVSRDFDYVERDVPRGGRGGPRPGAIVKVIFENAYLTDELKATACRICERAGADFVKTSTGFAKSGATLADLTLMRKTCSPRVKVKAAGGVRSLDAALSARAVGAVRCGATATVAIMTEAAQRAAAGKLTETDEPTELTKAY